MTRNPHFQVVVDADQGAPQIVVRPTSCRCGGDWAYLVQHGHTDDACRFTMLGCACHHEVSLTPILDGGWMASVAYVGE